MSDAIIAQADLAPMAKLIEVMQDYITLTGKDASKALNKAAREVDYGMLVAMRTQPPRPIQGDITSTARARDWALNVRATARAQATKLLAGYKSGYFRVLEGAGVVRAQAVYVGARGKVLKRKGKTGVLVTAKEQRGIPSDAKSLNWWSLAVLLELNLREKAARGGYMGAEFLTYKALNRDRVESATFYTKDHKGVGSVLPEADKVTISGRVPNADKIAAKYGIVDKAISAGADSYRVDMLEYIVDRNTKLLAKLGAFN